MPIFEFKCPECKYQFEVIQKHADKVSPCPNCKTASRRIPTAAAFRFGEQVRSPNSPDAVAEATAERRKKRELKP